jgi:DNA-binding CsgD family transcriptional regulator
LAAALRDAQVMQSQALSPREDEILELAAAGRSTKEIAAELSIAQSTVNWHVGNALTKLDASNRTEAVAKVLRGEASEREEAPRAHPTARRRRSAYVIATIATAVLILLGLVGLIVSGILGRMPLALAPT